MDEVAEEHTKDSSFDAFFHPYSPRSLSSAIGWLKKDSK